MNAYANRRNLDWHLLDILECGFAELDVLEDIDPDYISTEMLQYLKLTGDISYSSIIREIFLDFRTLLEESINENKDRLLPKMDHLNPAEDLTWYINGIATELSLSNYDDYKALFPDTLEQFEKDTGFTILDN